MRLTIDNRHYEAYMASSVWRARRKRWLDQHGAWCRSCGKRSEIELHHKRYDRLGREDDRDLVALCRMCHAGVHAVHDARPDLTLDQATSLVVHSPKVQRAEREESTFVPRNQRCRLTNAEILLLRKPGPSRSPKQKRAPKGKARLA